MIRVLPLCLLSVELVVASYFHGEKSGLQYGIETMNKLKAERDGYKLAGEQWEQASKNWEAASKSWQKRSIESMAAAVNSNHISEQSIKAAKDWRDVANRSCVVQVQK